MDSSVVFIATGQLADTPTHGLDISRTGQLAVWQVPPKERKLSMQVSGDIRELSSPLDVQSTSWRFHELSSNRIH